MFCFVGLLIMRNYSFSSEPQRHHRARHHRHGMERPALLRLACQLGRRAADIDDIGFDGSALAVSLEGELYLMTDPDLLELIIRSDTWCTGSPLAATIMSPNAPVRGSTPCRPARCAGEPGAVRTTAPSMPSREMMG